MSANTLPAQIQGTGIFPEWANAMKRALSGDLFARNSSGKVVDIAGSLGTAALRWAALHAIKAQIYANGNSGALVSPSGLAASLDMILPAGLPSDRKMLLIDQLGQMTTEYPYETQLTDWVNSELSSEQNIYNPSTSLADITNQSRTITTNGRPVEIIITGGDASLTSEIVSTGSSAGVLSYCRIAILRDGNVISLMENAVTGVFVIGNSGMYSHIDRNLPAGTYTYKAQGAANFAGSQWSDLKFYVQEL